MKEFGAAVQDTGREGKEEEDRIMISQAIIKCADISNPVSPAPPPTLSFAGVSLSLHLFSPSIPFLLFSIFPFPFILFLTCRPFPFPALHFFQLPLPQR